MEHLVETYGLWILFLLVLLESAGIPLPGETSLIGAGLLAAAGHFEIVSVIAVAAAAAIVGDNCGYWVGRIWGKKILTVWGPLERFSEKVLPASERFFARHGGKTVFFARFIAILRFTAAWLAGVAHMAWWRFFFWNAAGGIAWATGVGLLAYYGGKAAADAFDRYGWIGAAGVVASAALVLVFIHIWRRRITPEAEES